MLYKVLNFTRNLLWRLSKAITVGVRVIILSDGKVLLIQHSYRSGWYLPGGGIKSNETIEQAARREVIEETGVVLGELSLLGVFTDFEEGRSDQVIVFFSQLKRFNWNRCKEVKAISFFPITQLPINISSGTSRRINELLLNEYPRCSIW